MDFTPPGHIHAHDSPDGPHLGLPGVVVPQKVYRAGGQGQFQPLPPVTFYVNGHRGISLRDAELGFTTGLNDADLIPNLSNTDQQELTLRILVSIFELSSVYGEISSAHSVAWIRRLVPAQIDTPRR